MASNCEETIPLGVIVGQPLQTPSVSSVPVGQCMHDSIFGISPKTSLRCQCLDAFPEYDPWPTWPIH